MLRTMVAASLLAGAIRSHAADVAWAPAEAVHLDIQPATVGLLPWVLFDERSGLPQQTIVDMLVDPRGFVWAATQDGLARYNGRSWETINLPRSMGNYPRALRNAHDGGLWIGSFDGGLAHLRDGNWQVLDRSSGLPSNRIRGLLETGRTGDTVLWIATDRGVARLRGNTIRAYSEASGLPDLDTQGLCETALLTGARALVVGTAQGLARLSGDRFEPVPVPRELLGHSIYDIVENPGLHGHMALWVASYGGGIGVFEDGKWALLDQRSGLPSNVEVLTASRAGDGSAALWIGAEGGLVRFEHGRFTIYDERSGLPSREIWKVLETTSPGGVDTLWLGTFGGGVVRLSPNFWSAFDARVGLPGGSVTSVLLTTDAAGADQILVGTSEGAVVRYSGDRFLPVALPAELGHHFIDSMLETRAPGGGSTLWVTSFGGGIARRDGGRWTMLDAAALPDARIYKLIEGHAEDGSSVLWAATEGGVGRYERGHWTNYRERDGLPDKIVTDLLETTGADGRRTLWAATGKGLARFDGGRWSVFGNANGLENENITSLQLATDSEGTRWLWLGTFGGVARLRIDDPVARFESFSTPTSPPLPGGTVQSVAADRSGRIYVCTTRGIARLTPREPAAGTPGSFAVEVFAIEDGLPGSECQQGARLVDRFGRIWVGTTRGLAMFDPRSGRPDRSAKPLLIDSAGLTDGSRTLRGGEILSYTERNVTFASTLLAYGAESRIRYRYQLVGFDPAPSEWTAAAIKEYTNLGAGDYRFTVWAKDAQGIVSGPVGMAFSIRPAPWFTVWAFLGYAALIVLAAYAVMQLRLRALRQRTRQLEAEVAERTRELLAANDKLEQLATEDALTGVANRRKFDGVLEHEWRRAQRDGHWLTLALLDVDFFKAYNDRYGHGRGDECLRAVARVVEQQCARPSDLVARYGGEEFAIVLPDTDPAGASALLKAVLIAVDMLQIEHADSRCARHVTVSLGAISTRIGVNDDVNATLQRVDKLLYQAKEGGRHQAVLAEESGATHLLRV